MNEDTSVLETRLAAAQKEITALQQEIADRKNPELAKNLAALQASPVCAADEQHHADASTFVKHALLVKQNDKRWKANHGDCSGSGTLYSEREVAMKFRNIRPYVLSV